MTKYILALFFALCVQPVNAEVTPIQAGSAESSSVSQSTFMAAGLTATNYTGNAGVCVTGSTRTITAVSTAIEVCFAGSTSNNSGGQAGVGYLRDGAFVNGQSATELIVSLVNSSADTGRNASFCALDTGLTVGAQYNYCLTARTNTGTQTIPNSAGANPTNTSARFYVRSSY